MINGLALHTAILSLLPLFNSNVLKASCVLRHVSEFK